MAFNQRAGAEELGRTEKFAFSQSVPDGVGQLGCQISGIIVHVANTGDTVSRNSGKCHSAAATEWTCMSHSPGIRYLPDASLLQSGGECGHVQPGRIPTQNRVPVFSGEIICITNHVYRTASYLRPAHMHHYDVQFRKADHLIFERKVGFKNE